MFNVIHLPIEHLHDRKYICKNTPVAVYYIIQTFHSLHKKIGLILNTSVVLRKIIFNDQWIITRFNNTTFWANFNLLSFSLSYSILVIIKKSTDHNINTFYRIQNEANNLVIDVE